MCACSTQTTPADTSLHGATFTVENMTCAHCAGTIRRALEAGLPGAAVAIDLDTHRVTVDADTEVTAAIIRGAGYEPVLLTH